ncbi:MAG: S8 family serine peptidase [Candidatus Competibacteraceae bacterium]|nr:S8 family serine peptidase [Candidatus Competibacteraceae bacterium]
MSIFPRPVRSFSTLACAVAFSTSLMSVPAQADNKDPFNMDGQESPELLVYLAEKTDAEQWAANYGLKMRRQLVGKADAYVFVTPSVEEARKLLSIIRQDRAVTQAFNNRYVVALTQEPESCGNPWEESHCWDHPYDPPELPLPYDPYFDANLKLHAGQWHLYNEMGWTQINALGAWQQGATGTGVVIGVVDSGVDMAHPDLLVNTALSYDFTHDDNDPSPNTEMARQVYSHGTEVAGLAAARGGNGIGVIGVAPFAGVAGLRVPLHGSYGPGELATLDTFVDAIYFGEQEIPIKNHSYGPAAPYQPRDARVSALQETAAQGVIHVVAAGNGQKINTEVGEIRVRRDASARPYSIPEAITVAAVGPEGYHADYSNYGASVVVTAPSKACAGCKPGLLTTDVSGADGVNNPFFDLFPDPDYVDTFGGTSGSAPIVAGVLALAKQIRPELNSRWAKHLLANSSQMVDPEDHSSESDGGWQENAAGCRFNQNYGFGLVNADRLVALAGLKDLELTPLLTWDQALRIKPTVIPDADRTGVRFAFNFDSHKDPADALEEVGVSLRIEHARRGEVEIWLISPNGSKRRMMHRYDSDHDPFTTGIGIADDEGQIQPWTFWSHAFWGEDPHGQWTVVVQDTEHGALGTVDVVQLHLRMGRLKMRNFQFGSCEFGPQLLP